MSGVGNILNVCFGTYNPGNYTCVTACSISNSCFKERFRGVNEATSLGDLCQYLTHEDWFMREAAAGKFQELQNEAST